MLTRQLESAEDIEVVLRRLGFRRIGSFRLRFCNILILATIATTIRHVHDLLDALGFRLVRELLDSCRTVRATRVSHFCASMSADEIGDSNERECHGTPERKAGRMHTTIDGGDTCS